MSEECDNILMDLQVKPSFYLTNKRCQSLKLYWIQSRFAIETRQAKLEEFVEINIVQAQAFLRFRFGDKKLDQKKEIYPGENGGLIGIDRV